MDLQAVASRHKLNLGRDFRWVANKPANSPTCAWKLQNMHFRATGLVHILYSLANRLM